MTLWHTPTSRAKKAWTLLVLSRQSKQLVLMVPPWVLKTKTPPNVKALGKNWSDYICQCIDFRPGDSRLSSVVEEPTLLYELAEVRFEDTVELVCLASLHILVVVKVHHLHCWSMLRRLQVTLRGTERGRGGFVHVTLLLKHPQHKLL